MDPLSLLPISTLKSHRAGPRTPYFVHTCMPHTEELELASHKMGTQIFQSSRYKVIWSIIWQERDMWSRKQSIWWKILSGNQETAGDGRKGESWSGTWTPSVQWIGCVHPQCNRVQKGSHLQWWICTFRQIYSLVVKHPKESIQKKSQPKSQWKMFQF